jgi:hypothetical protein
MTYPLVALALCEVGAILLLPLFPLISVLQSGGLPSHEQTAVLVEQEHEAVESGG